MFPEKRVSFQNAPACYFIRNKKKIVAEELDFKLFIGPREPTVEMFILFVKLKVTK